jgi:diguanylate cyclase (GGDEF)-like protein
MIKNKISSYLIILSLLLLLSVISMSSFTHYIYKSLQHDGYMINHAGIIRGSIQRYSKLKLSECNKICEKIENQIEHEITIIKSIDLERRSPIVNQLNERIASLERYWKSLKDLGKSLSNETDNSIKNDFLALSELCWEIADSTVLLAEVLSSEKLINIRIYYFILAFNIVSALLLIGLIYKSVRNKLEKEVLLDYLTGLNNLKSFNINIKKEINRCARYDRKLSLILFDIDNFKILNDSFGHNVGDKALIELAMLVKNSVRKTDSVYRIGGDEFAIIAPEVQEEKAVELADKIRENVQNNNFFSVKKITLSLGVSSYQKNMTKSELIKTADKSLYLAKRQGKNKAAQLSGYKYHNLQ